MGVDIMTVEPPVGDTVQGFFELMRPQFSASEWCVSVWHVGTDSGVSDSAGHLLCFWFERRPRASMSTVLAV